MKELERVGPACIGSVSVTAEVYGYHKVHGSSRNSSNDKHQQQQQQQQQQQSYWHFLACTIQILDA